MAASLDFSEVSTLTSEVATCKSTYVADWLDAEVATGTSSEYRLTAWPPSI
jgi:hypothetical protein